MNKINFNEYVVKVGIVAGKWYETFSSPKSMSDEQHDSFDLDCITYSVSKEDVMDAMFFMVDVEEG